MRPRRSFCLTALVGLPLVLLSCQDNVTDPTGQHTDQHAPTSHASVVAQAASDPVTVTHFDGAYREYSFTVANNDPVVDISQPASIVIASVPLFDSSLGELISARLVIDGWLATAMLAHGVNPVYVSNEHAAGFTARAELDPVLTSLTGQHQIVLAQSYYEFLEAFGTFDDNFVAWVERQRSDDHDYAFDQTYMGADAGVFVQNGEAGAATDLRLSWRTQNFFIGGANHVGLSIDKFFHLQTEPTGAGTKPGIVALIRLVAALAFQHAGHDLYYSDFHASGAAQFQIAVTYTYQPNRPPVCEDATASVLELWPPNSRLRVVDVLGVTDPDGDLITIMVTRIEQDEPTNGTPDGTGTGTSTAQVRAERSGAGDGRVYHIGFDAADGRGGVCTGAVNVSVPHDRSGAAVDGGALYDSTK